MLSGKLQIISCPVTHSDDNSGKPGFRTYTASDQKRQHCCDHHDKHIFIIIMLLCFHFCHNSFHFFRIISVHLPEDTDKKCTDHTDRYCIVWKYKMFRNPFPDKIHPDCHDLQKRPDQSAGNCTDNCTEQPEL